MKIAVVQGGPSSEAFVSRSSARAVRGALEEAGFEVQCFELDPGLPGALLAFAPDVVFPAVHGAMGEDGCVQGLLEVLGLRYVGSDVRASAVAADKVASKVFFAQAGLRMARDRSLDLASLPADWGALLDSLRAEVGQDLIVKPSEGGSTIGISRVFASAKLEDFRSALEESFRHGERVLVEEYVRGKEVTCGVFEDESGPRALAVTLIQSQASDWYDFQSKYTPLGSVHQCPAPFDAQLTDRIQRAAVEAHRAIGARDLSRSDFIVDEGGAPILLEINTLPGMTDVSLYPEAARVSGMTFPELMKSLVENARRRPHRFQLQGRPLPEA